MNGSSVATANKAVDLSHNQNPQELQQHLHPLSGQITVRLLSQSGKQIDTHPYMMSSMTHTLVANTFVSKGSQTADRERVCGDAATRKQL